MRKRVVRLVHVGLGVEIGVGIVVLLGRVARLDGLVLLVHASWDLLECRKALAPVSLLADLVAVRRDHRLVVVLVPKGHDALGRGQAALVEGAAYLRQRNAVMANAYLLLRLRVIAAVSPRLPHWSG